MVLGGVVGVASERVGVVSERVIVVGVVLGIPGEVPGPWVWYMGLVDVVYGINRCGRG